MPSMAITGPFAAKFIVGKGVSAVISTVWFVVLARNTGIEVVAAFFLVSFTVSLLVVITDLDGLQASELGRLRDGNGTSVPIIRIKTLIKRLSRSIVLSPLLLVLLFSMDIWNPVILSASIIWFMLQSAVGSVYPVLISLNILTTEVYGLVSSRLFLLIVGWLLFRPELEFLIIIHLVSEALMLAIGILKLRKAIAEKVVTVDLKSSTSVTLTFALWQTIALAGLVILPRVETYIVDVTIGATGVAVMALAVRLVGPAEVFFSGLAYISFDRSRAEGFFTQSHKVFGGLAIAISFLLVLVSGSRLVETIVLWGFGDNYSQFTQPIALATSFKLASMGLSLPVEFSVRIFRPDLIAKSFFVYLAFGLLLALLIGIPQGIELVVIFSGLQLLRAVALCLFLQRGSQRLATPQQ